MKFILIHGRAQEGRKAEDIQQEWQGAFQRGLQKSGKTLPADLTIEFPYYGDLLKHLTDENRPMPQFPVNRGGATTKNEVAKNDFFAAVLGELAENRAVTQAEKAEVKKIIENHRGIENNERVQNLLAFLDRKGILAETFLKQFTTDVFLYLTVPSIKRQINDIVLEKFDHEPCVVVGHSLGSVVSYLILKNNPQFQVRKFITVGSPLGTAVIRKYLEGPLEMPACVKNGWFNAFDDRDVVALNPLDKMHFNIQPPIENKNDVQNHTKNRHGIDGYLDDMIVARQIFDALCI